MKAVIIAHCDDDCTSTNGFVDGRAYRARRCGYGWMARLENGAERFICADGGGGGHLQHRKVRRDYPFEEIRTAGHFEIRVVTPSEAS
jgi:hypothetical protein